VDARGRRLIGADDDQDAALTAAGLPAVVKPEHGAASRHTYLVGTLREGHRAVAVVRSVTGPASSRWGLTQTEVKLIGDVPWIIEINGRLGGFVHALLTAAGGPDLIRIALRTARGEADAIAPLTGDRVASQYFPPAPARGAESSTAGPTITTTCAVSWTASRRSWSPPTTTRHHAPSGRSLPSTPRITVDRRYLTSPCPRNDHA
jgi:biotin carboxylase